MQNYEFSLDGEKILFGIPSTTPLKFLKVHKLNRKTIDPYVLKCKDKLVKRGMIDTIKVFTKNGQYYLTAEGAHRLQALYLLFGKDSEVLIPILILPDCYSDDDVDKVIEIILDFNKDNKPFTMFDYVDRWAQTGNRPIFKEILDVMKSKKPGLTNAQVVTMYTGKKAEYSSIQDGSFTLKPKYRSYVNCIINTISSIKKRDGVDKAHGYFGTVSNNHVVFMHEWIDEMFRIDFKSPGRRELYFESFMTWFENKLHSHLLDAKNGTVTENPLKTDHTKAHTQFRAYIDTWIQEGKNPDDDSAAPYDYRELNKLEKK